MKQVHIFVSGFVRGVGYRAYVRHLARKMGLSGWVRNLPDGRVEAVIQANFSDEAESAKLIDKMVKLCEKGSFLSEIKNITVEKEEPKYTFDEFKILK